jgi:hypothetical protein
LNKLRCWAAIGLTLFAALCRSASAVELQFAGTVGNSGAAGATLVHTTLGRQGGGVIVDKQGRIYTGGGDRIIVLNRQGHELWEIRPPKPDFVIGFSNFTMSGDYLYFLAGPPVPWEKRYYQANYTMVEPNLCRTRMTPSAVAQLVVPSTAFANYTKMDISLTSDVRTGQVYIGYETSWDTPGEFTVFRAEDNGTLHKVFATAVSNGGLACDEAGNFYVGGYAGNGGIGNTGQISKFDSAGNSAPGTWPMKFPDLVVAGSFFYGEAMLTPGAIWEMGGNGFLGRYTRDFKPDPGLVATHLMPLFQTAQIAEAPDDTYYLKSPDALYQAVLKNGKIELQHRFGAIPVTHDLALTAQGYIGLGNEFLTLWFNFDDAAADAAPANAQYWGPAARGFADEEGGWATIGGGLPLDYNPPATRMSIVRTAPEPLIGNSTQTRLASGEFNARIYEIAKLGRSYFAIVGSPRQLMKSSEDKPFDLHPVEIADNGGLDSICTLGNSMLLLASKNCITAYQVNQSGTPSLLWTLTEAAPHNAFGDELHLAADGNQIFVADTQRQRVLLLSFDNINAPPALLAQYGETDIGGTEVDHLNHPTLVCLRAGRAVVYDSDNQRVVKLRLR